MKNYIIKESSNWADEFDIEGFRIFTNTSEEDIITKLIHGRTFPCEMYFGTNEAQEFETEGDFLNCLTIEEITTEEKDLLIKIFGENIIHYPFGTTAILGKI